MKKWIALTLTLVMVLGMAGCGGSTNEPEPIAAPDPTEEPNAEIWTIQQTTDEFGDITADSIPVLCTDIHGDFKNTATNSSELSGMVFFSLNENSGHYIAELSLLEYNRVAPTFHDNSEILLKVKVNDKIIEFIPAGEAPNGNLFLGIERYDYSGDLLFDYLYDGVDLRCILEIDDSQYNFNIQHGNIQELCENAGFPYGPYAMTVKDAVAILLEDSGEKPNEVITCLTSWADKTVPISYNEFQTSVMGLFLDIELYDLKKTGNSLYPMWAVRRYYEGGNEMIVSYSITASALSPTRTYEAWKNPPQTKGFEEDGELLARPYANGDGYTYYKCYKLTDNIFLLCMKGKDGAFTASDLLIRCSDASSDTAVRFSIKNAYNNDIRQIPN